MKILANKKNKNKKTQQNRIWIKLVIRKVIEIISDINYLKRIYFINKNYSGKSISLIKLMQQYMKL